MARRLALPAAVLALAVLVWLVWDRGGVPRPTVADLASADTSYDAYAWWVTHRREAVVRHYPDQVAPTVLAQPLPTQDGAISTRERGARYE